MGKEIPVFSVTKTDEAGDTLIILPGILPTRGAAPVARVTRLS